MQWILMVLEPWQLPPLVCASNICLPPPQMDAKSSNHFASAHLEKLEALTRLMPLCRGRFVAIDVALALYNMHEVGLALLGVT